MFDKKHSFALAPNATLRWTEPGGNSRKFTNFAPPIGVRAGTPNRLGSARAGFHRNSGVLSAKVDKL
jgi:hypothetical protein